jgi:hypothetical protein
MIDIFPPCFYYSPQPINSLHFPLPLYFISLIEFIPCPVVILLNLSWARQRWEIGNKVSISVQCPNWFNQLLNERLDLLRKLNKICHPWFVIVGLWFHILNAGEDGWDHVFVYILRLLNQFMEFGMILFKRVSKPSFSLFLDNCDKGNLQGVFILLQYLVDASLELLTCTLQNQIVGTLPAC